MKWINARSGYNQSQRWIYDPDGREWEIGYRLHQTNHNDVEIDQVMTPHTDLFILNHVIMIVI